MDLPAHTRERIAEIEALHKSVPIKVTGRLFRVDGCLLCRVPFPCSQARWAADVKSGRREPAGWRR